MNVTKEMVRECWHAATKEGFPYNKPLAKVFRFANELASRLLQPVEGPPDLEGVPDDAEYFVWIGCQQPDGSWHTGRRNLKTAAYLRALDDWLRVDWHIQIPDIYTLPEPELPKCQDCNLPLKTVFLPTHYNGTWVYLSCEGCKWRSETHKTEAEAIAACRKAGE